MPNVDINPASAVARHARFNPDATAVVYAGGDLTYADLNDKAARFATVLTQNGVAQEDRVAFLGMNSTSFLVTMLAAFRLGAIFVPVNFRLAPPETLAVLEQSGASVLVCEEGHRALVDGLVKPAVLEALFLVDDDSEVPASSSAARWTSWSSAIASASPTAEVSTRTEDDVAILMFTSGTTGRSKGVTLTHGNIWWNSLNVELMVDSRIGDTTHAAAPLFHVGALNSFVLRALVRGNRVVVRRAFDPAQTLDDYTHYQVNSTFAVPAMFIAMQRLPEFDAADLSTLRAVVVAGAPVPPSVITDWAKRGVMLQQAWGLTETAPFATHLPVDWTLTKTGSAGIPMPYTEVRVVDVVTGEPVATGERGEVIVRGPNVTSGYWKNDEATGAAFDADGWFHSGDIGFLDDDSCLYIVDRLKDMIISGGENVYPAEVERALADLEGLNDVAVIGVPDEQWGEIVVALGSVQPGADITLETVREHAANKVARYKLPSRFLIVDAVPRNASGKLDKTNIRRLAGETDERG
ncbi:AMP-binding protein [Nocardioides pocheonensis]|nr:AMP-binding protein [Nocardioides pocheonensis]